MKQKKCSYEFFAMIYKYIQAKTAKVSDWLLLLYTVNLSIV